MRQTLLRITARIWPELDRMTAVMRRASAADLLGVLYAAPTAAIGLIWLASVSDFARLESQWSVALFFAALLLAFHLVEFFLYVEVTPGTYFDWTDSFAPVIEWSVALILGPVGLWLCLPYPLVYSASWLRRTSSPAGRLNWARNLSFSLAGTIFSSLAGLNVYQRLGGVYPLPGLQARYVGPALLAMLVRWALATCPWVPLFLLSASPETAGQSSLRARARLWASVFLTYLIVQPFGILAAGLYGENGWEGYLSVAAGLFLTSLLARQLGHAVESSGQRYRELESLERLSGALIAAPPGIPALEQVLKQHTPDMIPYAAIEILLFPDRVLLRHPRDQPPVAAAAWDWLRQNPRTLNLAPGEIPPWDEQPATKALVAAPILDVTTAQPVGGIMLWGHAHPTVPVASLLPATLTALQSLAAHIASDLHSSEVYAQTLELQKVEHELALAARIQAGFLPQQLPQIEGWQWSVALRSAREMSGDFFDWFPLPNGHTALVVADVADKGMGAALYMTMTRSLIRTFASEHPAEPARVLTDANQRILSDARAGLFVSLFFGVLDPGSGRLIYGNAGHNPPLLVGASNPGETRLLKGTGMVLGVLEDATWQQRSTRLKAGEVLVVYTDGVTEALGRDGLPFGEQRLADVVRANVGRAAAEIKDAVLASLDDFVGQVPQADDITLLVVRRE